MLNHAQNRVYWAAWRECAAALRRKGVRSRRELEECRHALHISALGELKSHHDLDQLELARVLKSFRGFASTHRGRANLTNAP